MSLKIPFSHMEKLWSDMLKHHFHKHTQEISAKQGRETALWPIVEVEKVNPDPILRMQSFCNLCLPLSAWEAQAGRQAVGPTTYLGERLGRS